MNKNSVSFEKMRLYRLDLACRNVKNRVHGRKTSFWSGANARRKEAIRSLGKSQAGRVSKVPTLRHERLEGSRRLQGANGFARWRSDVRWQCGCCCSDSERE